MTRAQSLLKELKDVYDGAPWYGHPLKTVLADVDDALLARQPRIAELLRHIVAWLKISARRVSGEVFEVTHEMDFPPVSAGGWREQAERLARAHKQLVRIVKNYNDDDLDRIVAGKEHTIEFELRGVVQHCIYHEAQIALLKKL